MTEQALLIHEYIVLDSAGVPSKLDLFGVQVAFIRVKSQVTSKALKTHHKPRAAP